MCTKVILRKDRQMSEIICVLVGRITVFSHELYSLFKAIQVYIVVVIFCQCVSKYNIVLGFCLYSIASTFPSPLA